VDDFGSSIKGAILGGIIVFLILAMFAPFGLVETGNKIYLYAGIFGLISAVVSLLVDLLFKYVLKIRRDVEDWKFWKWILSILFLVLMIAIANHQYAVYTFGESRGNFFQMVYSTCVVAIFPILVFGSLNLIRNLKANQRIASEVSYKPEKNEASANVSLPIKNSTKTFELDASKIIYLESMQNYVLIHYLGDEGQVLKETHRNTISAIGEALKPYGMKRTHRSFLVNPRMIKSISGNAQGLKLMMAEGEGVVPVSRKYIHEFRD